MDTVTPTPTPTPAATTQAVTLAWPDLLDALEHRNRLCEQLLRQRGPALPDVELRAVGPLPGALADRARLLLAQTQDLEQRTGVRVDRAATALHYGRR